jgi:hypothetical protein
VLLPMRVPRRPERRLGLVEAIGHAAVRAILGTGGTGEAAQGPRRRSGGRDAGANGAYVRGFAAR